MQPVSYLSILPEDARPALTFIVPEQRIPTVWNELKERCSQKALDLADESSAGNVTRVRIGSRILLITSWKYILEVLLEATNSGGYAAITGLCRAERPGELGTFVRQGLRRRRSWSVDQFGFCYVRNRARAASRPSAQQRVVVRTARGVQSRGCRRWRGVPTISPMEYKRGDGAVITGDAPERDDPRVPRRLSAPDVLAVNTLGTLAENPRVIALREFITSWHLSYLSAGAARGSPKAGGEERLFPTGDNLANVIQHLHDQHPERLNEIFKILRRRVPRIEKVETEVLVDSRLASSLQGRPVLDTSALPVHIERHTENACLSDAPARSDPAEADRRRGTGKFPAPTAPS